MFSSQIHTFVAILVTWAEKKESRLLPDFGEHLKETNLHNVASGVSQRPAFLTL